METDDINQAVANKQMVSGVYENCVVMLEKLESWELWRNDMETKQETCLELFQSKMVSWDWEIKEEVQKKLIAWASKRGNRKIPNGITDAYVKRLLGVLEKSETEHSKVFNQRQAIDETGMHNVLQGSVHGNHRKDKMDKDFKENPDKNVKAQMISGCEGISQANKQMVSGVYENCVVMLEKLESWELWHNDMETKQETCLELFQSKMVSWDWEIKEEVQQKLIAWASKRGNRKIPNGITDAYVKRLLGVLEKSETEHSKVFNQRQAIDETGMHNVLQGSVHGNHRKDKMDKDFKENPDKNVKAQMISGCEGISQDQSSGKSHQTQHSNRRPPVGQKSPNTEEIMETEDHPNEAGNRLVTGYKACNQTHEYSHIRHPYHGYTGQHDHAQTQVQGQIFRSAQASKQMVYEVYGNCVTMLEEFENRELRRKGVQPMPRSDIYLPDQQKYDDSTIQTKLEAQLLLFKCQIVSCDAEIKDEVRQELKENILVWNSVREDRKIPSGYTDHYVGKLFQVLESGKTEHPKEFYQPPTIDEAEMHNVLQGMVQGIHRNDMLDKDFKKNPTKKATAPKTRTGEGINQGAQRLARNNPQMTGAVAKHIRPDMK